MSCLLLTPCSLLGVGMHTWCPCSHRQVGILCEQGRETLTSNIHVLPREKVRTENAQSCSGGKQGGGKEACEGVELSVSINI